MSMNLNCNLVGLVQTPTQITDMCMVQPDGSVAWELTGKSARHALQIYIQWLIGSCNGEYKSKEDADEYREYVMSQVNAVKKIINKRNLIVRKT